MRFSIKKLVPVFAVGLLIFARGTSFVTPASAGSLCVPYVLNDGLLDEVLNSPQMTPLSDWEITKGLSNWQRGCTWSKEAALGLTYALPNSFSKLGIQYSFNVSIRVSVDTGRVVSASLDKVNQTALQVKGVIQRTENHAAVKEFMDKIGIDKANIDHAFIEYRDKSFKSYIKYNTGISGLPAGIYSYDLPGSIEWTGIPEIVRLRSIFQNETPPKNCYIDLRDARLHPLHGTTVGYGKPGWDFYVDVLPGEAEAGCPPRIVATIFDDGAQAIRHVAPLKPPTPSAESLIEVVKLKTPDVISALLVEQKIVIAVESIKLNDDQTQYNVVGYRTVRLFGFIRIKLKLHLVVDAITGAVESISKPWWVFFVRY